MSQTIIATIISILAVVLPLLGINVGSEALTTTAQTILVIGSGLWVWKERATKLRRIDLGERSDVNPLGGRRRA